MDNVRKRFRSRRAQNPEARLDPACYEKNLDVRQEDSAVIGRDAARKRKWDTRNRFTNCLYFSQVRRPACAGTGRRHDLHKRCRTGCYKAEFVCGNFALGLKCSATEIETLPPGCFTDLKINVTGAHKAFLVERVYTCIIGPNAVNPGLRCGPGKGGGFFSVKVLE